MVAGKGAQRVPGDLRVVMAVIVDEAGGDDPAVGVDRPRGRAAQFADLDDLAVLDPDIAAEGRHPRAVDDAAVLDQQIIRHRYPFLCLRARVEVLGKLSTRRASPCTAKSKAWSSFLAWLECGAARRRLSPRERGSTIGQIQPVGGNDDVKPVAAAVVAARYSGRRRRYRRRGGSRNAAAFAQDNAKLGTPASVITNPPRDWDRGNPSIYPGPRRHRRRSVLSAAAAVPGRDLPGVDRRAMGRGPGLVEPGPIPRLQRRLGQCAIPLYLGRRPGDGVPPAFLQQQRQHLRFSGPAAFVRAFQPPRRALGA